MRYFPKHSHGGLNRPSLSLPPRFTWRSTKSKAWKYSFNATTPSQASSVPPMPSVSCQRCTPRAVSSFLTAIPSSFHSASRRVNQAGENAGANHGQLMARRLRNLLILLRGQPEDDAVGGNLDYCRSATP